MLFTAPFFCTAVLLLAVVLDRYFGEPDRWHPLVGFGVLTKKIEARFWFSQCRRLQGVFAVTCLLVIVFLPAVLLQVYLTSLPVVHFIVASLVVYVCIAPRSLREHALAVANPLQQSDLAEARRQLSRIVSRDVSELSASEVAAATCESVLENGSDAIFSAIFWYLVAGVPGIVLYRIANTLDAMWGYRNTRYINFGWAAAKLDDWLNWLPARLVALSYALMGQFTTALRCWRLQGGQWKSPNAGPVMSAGAGSLGICLGGAASYHGEQQQRTTLGEGSPATVRDIYRAIQLVERVLFFWLLLVLMFALIVGWG